MRFFSLIDKAPGTFQIVTKLKWRAHPQETRTTTLKPWLATYRDNGIPETVNADAWPSVVHLLENAMRRYADKPAFRAFGRTQALPMWMDRQSAAFAAWLRAA